MRFPLLPLLTLAAVGLASCADHSSSNAAANDTSAPTTEKPNQPETLSQKPPQVPAEPGHGNPEVTLSGGGQGSGGGDGGDGGDGGGAGPVPEPSTLLLVGTGLAGLAILRRRRRGPESS